MFKGLQETVRDNKSSNYGVFELPGVNCSYIGETAWHLSERVVDHAGGDTKSHIVRHCLHLSLDIV